MSEYQKKSEEYKRAAEQSNAAKLYSAVGHTAYYSCFLLMEHIQTSSVSFSEDDLDFRQFDCAGSHEKTINEISQYIKSTSKKDSLRFHNNICDLKRLRTSADYDDEPFRLTDASQSITLMNLTLNILMNYL